MLSRFWPERDYYNRKNNQHMRRNQAYESIFPTMKPDQADADPQTSGKSAFLPSVFDDLFSEHWPQVYRLLLRLVGDPSEAEDLALETFLRLYQHLPANADGFNFGGWLHSVAANLGLHAIRAYGRRERYELAAGRAALEAAAEDRPAEILAREEENRAARQVLAEMPDRQSQLLILRYSGRSYKEIAAALKVSPASIGQLLLRAEREFEKRYRILFREEEK